MKVHTIMTYFEESHDTTFHILVDDDETLLHALTVIRDSKDVTYYEVDGGDGPSFFDLVFRRVYPGLRLSTQTTNEVREE